MLAFQHQVHFADEPALATGPVAPHTLPTVLVRRGLWQPDNFPLPGQWQSASGQRIRYLSNASHHSVDPATHWTLEVEGVLLCWWNDTNLEICYQTLAEYSPARLQFWVLHTVLPLLLSLQSRMEILHVGAVQLASEPVLFSAPSTGGKSTLVAYFLEQGHSLMADDTLGVQLDSGRCLAIPGYPFHRPHRELESLGLAVANTTSEPLQIRRIYCLQPTQPDADITIRALAGLARFQALSQARYIQFPSLIERQFAFIGELVARVHVYQIDVPQALERLPEVYHTLRDHLSSPPESTPGVRPII